jgi:hypothetical protein
MSEQMKKGSRRVESTFLNVDLEILSSQSLEPLVSAFGDSVDVLFLGKDKRRHLACLELTGSALHQSPDCIIQRLVQLIRDLPEPARALWNKARERYFDVGIQAESVPAAFRLPLENATIAAVGEVNAGITFTVYAPRPRKASKKRRAFHPGE